MPVATAGARCEPLPPAQGPLLLTTDHHLPAGAPSEEKSAASGDCTPVAGTRRCATTPNAPSRRAGRFWSSTPPKGVDIGSPKHEEIPAHVRRSLFLDYDVEDDDDSVPAVRLDQSTVQNIVPARAQDVAPKEYTSPKSKIGKPPAALLTPQGPTASRTPTKSGTRGHEREDTAAKNPVDHVAAVGNTESRRVDAPMPAGLCTPAKHQPMAHVCSPSTIRLPGAHKKASIMNTPEIAPVNFYKHGTPSPVIAQTSRRGVIDALTPAMPEIAEEKPGRIVDAAQ